MVNRFRQGFPQEEDSEDDKDDEDGENDDDEEKSSIPKEPLLALIIHIKIPDFGVSEALNCVGLHFVL